MSLARHFPNYRGNEWGSLFRLLDDYNDHITTRGSGLTTGSFTPRFDVRETKDAYHLEGELPGINQKDVELEFTDPNTLVIKGSSKREHTVQPSEDQGDSEAGPSHKYWATERSFGQFSRTFSLPVRVDQDAVKASLKNGILHVTVPKAAAPASKKINIESE